MGITPRPIKTSTRRTSHEVVNSIGSGPYLAKVVGHLDKTFMGSLKVQLLRTSSSGDDDSREGQIKIVSYASPFYGVTPLYSAGDADNYQNTQQSYGFWAVPPDVGTLVLVSFVEGLDDFGFWFACVSDDFMNFMVPDGRAATSNTSSSTPQYLKGKKLPVGEYNKNKVDSQGQNQPTYYPRPINSDFVRQLEQQGLLDDDIRGVTSSSARRETPSSVFGMNTPGPLDKRPGAPQILKGTQESQATMFSSRLGGHSIVMDDGDDKILRKGPASSNPAEYANKDSNERGGDPTLPANELFRIRTRTGHQILLHNTEDLIYISNSKGTSWIELTANGKIDIYAQDSISIHSQEDINFTADRDINFTAYEDINLIAGKEFKMDTGDSMSLTTGNFFSLNAADSISQTAGTFIAGYASSSITFTANDNLTLLSGATLNVGASGEIGIEGCAAVKISTDGNYHNKALGLMYTQADGSIHTKSGTAIFQESAASTNIKSGALIFQQAAGNINIKSGGTLNMDGGPNVRINEGSSANATEADPAVLPPIPDPVVPYEPLRAARAARVPEHEPWFQHENLNPGAYTPERTRAGNQQVDSFIVPRTDGGTGVTPDTYLPPSRSQQSGTINAAFNPQFDATRGTPAAYSEPFGGIDQTTNLNAYRGTPGEPLPESKLPGVINGFSRAQTAAYFGAIGKRESNNAYDAVNTLGFSGKYQFGDGALEDLGYLKPGTSKLYSVKNALGIAANWTGKDGITDRQKWLESPEIQESAMLAYTNMNLKRLQGNGGIRQGDTIDVIAGMLAGAHLLGPGGMKKWRNGQGGADAYGTTGGEYFALGRSAVPNTSSTASGGPV